MADSYLLRVVEVVAETADACSLVFDVDDQFADRFTYRPGQFLTVRIPSDRTGSVARCYSLSSSPHTDDRLRVTVKRTADGYGSNWLCDEIRAGAELECLPPAGVFTPRSLDEDLLLFAAGSGITPVLSIVKSALAAGSGRVTLVYANRDERSVIFAQALTELAAEHPDRLQVVHWLESVQGLPTAEQLRAFAAGRETWDAFVCGPAPFMKLVVGALKELEFPRERRHQEKFVSLGGNPFGDEAGAAKAAEEVAAAESDDEPDRQEEAPAAPTGPAVSLEVELDGEKHAFDDWDPSVRMLQFLESKGVKAPYSCREGECSACAVRLLEGAVQMAHNDVLDEEDLEDGIRLACQSTPTSETVRATYS